MVKSTSAHLYLLFLIISCTNMSSSKNIRFNPNIGTAYKYHISRSRNVTQMIGNSPIISGYNEEIDFIYKVLSMEKDSYKSSVKFDDYNIVNDKTPNDSSVTNEDDSAQNRQIIRNVFLGSIFDLEINEYGYLKNISGFRTFINKKDSLLSMETVLPKAAVGAYSENYFKCLFTKSLHFFPDSPVFLNSSWVTFDSTEFGDPIKMKTIYKVLNIKNGIIYISTLANIDQPLNNIPGSPIMKGTEKGVIELDSTTGQVMNSERILSIKGSVKLGTLDMLMKVTNIIKVKGTLY